MGATSNSFPSFPGVAPNSSRNMSLTDAAIRQAKPTDKPQRLFDGGGLYLYVAVPVPFARFPMIVLLRAVIDPAPLVRPTPPPLAAAVFPLIVVFWRSSVLAKVRNEMPPPDAPAVFPVIALLRTRTMLGVNPLGGVALAVPEKSTPPPFPVPVAALPEIVVLSTTRPPPLVK